MLEVQKPIMLYCGKNNQYSFFESMDSKYLITKENGFNIFIDSIFKGQAKTRSKAIAYIEVATGKDVVIGRDLKWVNHPSGVGSMVLARMKN
jgi:hypothetical protein